MVSGLIAAWWLCFGEKNDGQSSTGKKYLGGLWHFQSEFVVNMRSSQLIKYRREW